MARVPCIAAACMAGALTGVASAQPVTLPEVQVSAPRVAGTWLTTPAALSVVEGPDITRARPATQLDAALARVPGAFAQNGANFAQDLRVSIRGQGARAPFGLRGIAVLVDGIPQTLPDGQSQVDGVDLLAISRMEVLRGPASALYGNAAGGVVDVHTAWFDGPRLTAQAGGFGLRRARTDAGGRAGAWQWTASADALAVDGDRAQSAYLRRLARAKARRPVGTGGTFTVLADALDTPRAEDPGALTGAERRADADAAAPFALRLNAGEDKDQQALALRYEHAFDAGELRAQVYGSRRDFAAQLAFPGSSAVRFARAFHGAGLEWRAALGDTQGEWLAGIDARFQDDRRERFGRGADASVGPRDLYQREAAQALGTYLLARTDPAARWQASAGLRRDALHLAVHDRLSADGDDSGTRRYRASSGEAAVGLAITPAHRAWLRAATAFETPTFTEFANPAGGGLNPDLEPQRTRGVDVGLKGIAGPALRYEIVAFALRVRDELTPFQLPGDGRDFFANTGRARHHGIETAVSWRLRPDWRLAASYTWARHRLHDPRTPDGTTLGDVDRPGLPRHTGWAQLQWDRPGGRFAELELTASGPRHADTAGTAHAAGHVLVGLRAGRRLALGGGTLEVWGGVENLLDADYTGNLRVDAAGARYFEPGPGRAVHAGLAWSPAVR